MNISRLSSHSPVVSIALFTAVFLATTDASARRHQAPRARFHLHVAADSGGPENPPSLSEPATMTGRGPGAIGGFGGVQVGYAPIAGGNGLLIGGEGAMLLGHRFSIGGAGFGLVNEIASDGTGNDPSRVGLGYGGVVLRYHLVQRYPVYPTLGTLLGFGSVSFDGNGGDAVMIIEPSAGFYMNITRWLRVGFSLSYKYATGVNTAGLDNSDFRGPAFTGHIDFGAL